MVGLNESAQERIAKAIANAEQQTSGEIMLAITPQSGDWRAASLAVSTGISLTAALLLWLARPDTLFPLLWILQVAVLLLCEVIFHMTGWASGLVPDSAKLQAARRHAHSLFFARGLHSRTERSTIIIFISLAERYAELMLDEGIRSKEKPEVWQGIADRLTAQIKTGGMEAALLGTVEACGGYLRAHYPSSGGNPDELPNIVRL